VGASYGSSLALIYAADHPNVAAIALLSPGLNYFGNMQTEPAIKKYGERPVYMAAADDDRESAVAVISLIPDTETNKAHRMKIYPVGGHGTALLRSQPSVPDEIKYFLIWNVLRPAK
jgi:pimeloyl-ACP methyl ester carboxylesterase